MRVSREKAAENRERIVDTAARLFRETGFDGVGVDEIMNGAGLTHGGFYGHFGSMEDLATRSRGYAQALLGAVSRMIVARGETPFLHVFSDNAPAIALYHRMGQGIRRLYVTVLGNHS